MTKHIQENQSKAAHGVEDGLKLDEMRHLYSSHLSLLLFIRTGYEIVIYSYIYPILVPNGYGEVGPWGTEWSLVM